MTDGTDWRSVDRLRAAMRVYAITPDGFFDGPWQSRLVAAIDGGVTALQVRDKQQSASIDALHDARAMCADRNVLFVVNDDPKRCTLLQADAIHVGPNDRSPSKLRKELGTSVVIGASAGSSDAAAEWQQQGADYVGVGAIFDAHASKSDASAARGVDVIRRVRAAVPLPIVAIGGITAERASSCMAAGADGVAAIRGLLGSADPYEAARAFAAAVGTVEPGRTKSVVIERDRGKPNRS